MISTGKVLLWFFTVIVLSPSAMQAESAKGTVADDEEKEIVENLDILESYEVLKDMDLFDDNYEVLEKGDETGGYTDVGG